MNLALLREDLAAANLPAVVSSGSMFNPCTQCYCIFGGIAKHLGMDAAAQSEGELDDSIYESLESRYGSLPYGLADTAINNVRTRLGVLWGEPVPTAPAVKEFLAMLDERGAATSVEFEDDLPF